MNYIILTLPHQVKFFLCVNIVQFSNMKSS